MRSKRGNKTVSKTAKNQLNDNNSRRLHVSEATASASGLNLTKPNLRIDHRLSTRNSGVHRRFVAMTYMNVCVCKYEYSQLWIIVPKRMFDKCRFGCVHNIVLKYTHKHCYVCSG